MAEKILTKDSQLRCAFCNRELGENDSFKTAIVEKWRNGRYEPVSLVTLCNGPSLDEAKKSGLLPRNYGFPLSLPEEDIEYFKVIRLCKDVFEALNTRYEGAGLVKAVHIIEGD